METGQQYSKISQKASKQNKGDLQNTLNASDKKDKIFNAFHDESKCQFLYNFSKFLFPAS